MKTTTRRSLLYTVFFLFLLQIWVIGNTQSGRDSYKDILEVDAVGYYSYLPALFVYQDPNFSFLDKIDNKYISSTISLVRYSAEGGDIDRYFIGTTFLMAPFYLLGTFCSYLLNVPNDGYTKYQLLSISIGASMYLYIGLYIIGLFLKNTFQLTQKSILLTIIAFALGTNLFYYSIFEPGMSHVYSFFTVALFIYVWSKFMNTQKFSYFLIASLLLGLITIIRPVNILIVLSLPVIWPTTFIKTITPLFTNKLHVLVAAFVLFISIIGIQLSYYKIATGHWYVYSYNKEGFDFTQPHIWDVLFSYRKGLFVYMPILFISIAGLYYWNKQQKYTTVLWAIAFTIITYILSSWSSWSYGGCYSNRAFIEYYIFFIIPFAYLIEHLLIKIPKTVYAGIVCILLFCQIQTYQYRYYYIHWDEMNKEKYWKVFLRVDYLIKKTPVKEIY
jgi:hypothetical protein